MDKINIQKVHYKKTMLNSVKKRNPVIEDIIKNRWLYLLILPGMLFYIVFKYLPMWGIIIAFMEYHPITGIFGSEWVGFKHFTTFFGDAEFLILFRNTLTLSLANIAFTFPLPIIMALMLNEVRNKYFRNGVQTLVFVPHFISMVIIASITYLLLTTDNGIINNLVFQLTGNRIHFLSDPAWFRPVIIIQNIWKETGWGTIIYTAALSNIDVSQYEAAIVDGASRWQKLIYITLPSIAGTVMILLILRVGNVLSVGFEQIFLMSNALNREVSQVFDTYIYYNGITKGSFSYSTAIGLFMSLVNIICVFSTNAFAKKTTGVGLY